MGKKNNDVKSPKAWTFSTNSYGTKRVGCILLFGYKNICCGPSMWGLTDRICWKRRLRHYISNHEEYYPRYIFSESKCGTTIVAAKWEPRSEAQHVKVTAMLTYPASLASLPSLLRATRGQCLASFQIPTSLSILYQLSAALCHSCHFLVFGILGKRPSLWCRCTDGLLLMEIITVNPAPTWA